MWNPNPNHEVLGKILRVGLIFKTCFCPEPVTCTFCLPCKATQFPGYFYRQTITLLTLLAALLQDIFWKSNKSHNLVCYSLLWYHLLWTRSLAAILAFFVHSQVFMAVTHSQVLLLGGELLPWKWTKWQRCLAESRDDYLRFTHTCLI